MAKLKHLLPDKQLNESGLARLAKHMAEHDCGTITAFRSKEGCAGPEDMPYTRADNQKRNRQLYANLQMMGYAATAVHGAYIENYGTPDAKEVRENVYFVVDIKDTGRLRDDLVKLGNKYQQDSILFIPVGGAGSILIGTNDCPNSYPGFGKAEDKDFVQIWDLTASSKYAKKHLTERKKFYREAKYPFSIDKVNYI